MPDGAGERGSVQEFTDPYLETYTPVPPHAAGICDVCHRAPGAGYSRCMSCNYTVRDVQHPITVVVPISFYVLLTQLHQVLRGYKDNSDANLRARWTIQVAAIIGRFVDTHGECIREAAGPWDTIVTLPTRSGRLGTHPLDTALSMLVPGVGHRSPLLLPGADAVSRQAKEHGYEPTNDARGRRVLLLDDTFTSGAHVQSAATALTRGGATVVAALVIGRVIDLNFTPVEAETLWKAARARPFSFAVCCLCDTPW